MPAILDNNFVATFVKDRETKNTVRFNEAVDGDDTPVVGTLYVRKDALVAMGAEDADAVTMTLTVAIAADAAA
jgi:hypothetical protein